MGGSGIWGGIYKAKRRTKRRGSAMIDSARDYWFFILVFIVAGAAYFKTVREAIKRIMKRK